MFDENTIKTIVMYGSLVTAIGVIGGAMWYAPGFALKKAQEIVVVPVVEPAVKAVAENAAAAAAASAESVEQIDKNAAEFKSEAYSRFIRQDRMELYELEELSKNGRLTQDKRLRMDDLKKNLEQFSDEQKVLREKLTD